MDYESKEDLNCWNCHEAHIYCSCSPRGWKPLTKKVKPVKPPAVHPCLDCGEEQKPGYTPYCGWICAAMNGALDGQ